MAMDRILAFSIDLLRRLYNTLALPCERVIRWQLDTAMQTRQSLQLRSYYSTAVFALFHHSQIHQ